MDLISVLFVLISVCEILQLVSSEHKKLSSFINSIKVDSYFPANVLLFLPVVVDVLLYFLFKIF